MSTSIPYQHRSASRAAASLTASDVDEAREWSDRSSIAGFICREIEAGERLIGAH